MWMKHSRHVRSVLALGVVVGVIFLSEPAFAHAPSHRHHKHDTAHEHHFGRSDQRGQVRPRGHAAATHDGLEKCSISDRSDAVLSGACRIEQARGSVLLIETILSALQGLSVVTAAYLASLSTALASLVGLLLLPLPSEVSSLASTALLSFAAGALLADTALHLLPHAYAHAPRVAGFGVLSGIAVFFVFDRVIIASFGHDHAHPHPHADNVKAHIDHSHAKDAEVSDAQAVGNISHAGSGAYMNLAADALHNFCDGLSIGAAFQASMAAGLSTTIAVFLHEVPQELGDYMLLRRGGFSRAGALAANVSCAMSAMVGTAAALHAAAIFDGAEDVVLPFCAGGLLYMAIAAVLPEIAQALVASSRSDSSSIATIARSAAVGICGLCGIAVVRLIEFVAHGEGGHAY